jgi:predicted secreted protein
MTQAFKGQGTQLQRVGVTVAEIINIDGPDGKAEFDDCTNMDSPSAFKEWIPTLLDSGELSFTGNFIGAADASQAQLIADFNAQTLSTWTVLFPGGKGQIDFSAYVGQFSLKVPHDKKVDFSSKLKITGPVTIS